MDVVRSLMNGRDTAAWASPCACAGRAEQRHQKRTQHLVQLLRQVVSAEAQAALRGAYRNGIQKTHAN